MLQLEKRETIADVINLVLGAWLFLTPWIFGFVPKACRQLSQIVAAARWRAARKFLAVLS